MQRIAPARSRSIFLIRFINKSFPEKNKSAPWLKQADRDRFSIAWTREIGKLSEGKFTIAKTNTSLYNGKYKKRTYIRKKRSVRSGGHRRKNTRQKSNTSTLPELLQQQIVRFDRWLFRNPPDQMSQMQKRGGDTAGTLQWTAIQKADLLLQNT